LAFWINTISREHVRIGMEGGYTQANHGRPATLRRLRRGDLIAFYSPRTSYPDGERLQEFTAIARVIDDEPHQAEMRPDFHPWRRLVEAVPSMGAAIAPLIPSSASSPTSGIGASCSAEACSKSARTTSDASPAR
jgi:hypothetical protein